MDKLHDLKDKLCEELEEIARKPDMGAGDLEVIHKLTDTIKNIDKICALEEDGGYSSAVDGMEKGRGPTTAGTAEAGIVPAVTAGAGTAVTMGGRK